MILYHKIKKKNKKKHQSAPKENLDEIEKII